MRYIKAARVAVAFVAVVGVPTSAHAAVSAHYPNQAAAQKAHDTSDADGDGIYCESLPCPCSTARPGSTTCKPTTRKPTSSTAKRPQIGRPKDLGKRTGATGCQVRGPLPDPRCTPGSVFSKSTPRVFCKSGYTKLVRHVTVATERKVFAAYGITQHHAGEYEIDHLVPLELGGSNSVANLFPEAAKPRPGFHDKDDLENEVHDRVCEGRNSYRSLQRTIAPDWTKLYMQLVGRLPGT